MLDGLQKLKLPLQISELTFINSILRDSKIIQSSCTTPEASKYWFCSSLFQVVKDLEVLLALLAAVMQEKSVVCYGFNLNKVSGVILGLESLLRPFTWHMALIPILPEMLLDTLEAPVPILVGITTSEYE